jgi:hypothetical protein
MTDANELLLLAREAEAKAKADPINWALVRTRNLYVDTLAMTLDIAYQTAYEMVLDQDFRLPKEKKPKKA